MLMLIALCSFATVTLGLIAVLNRPPHPVRVRARMLGSEARPAVVPATSPFTSRVMLPVARSSANLLLGLLPNRWLRRMERLLIAAGEPLDLGMFVLVCGLLGVAAAGVCALWLGWTGFFLGALGGSLAPVLWLRRHVRARQRRISLALPDAIDLLVTCVEAGLGLDAALQRVGEATEGPLGTEIRATLRQIAVGRPRQEALLDLGVRTGVSDLDAFIRPIVQAERSGVSIGATLRVQAEHLRVQRRQRAQEYAQKMPVKMTLPIAIFFLPAVIIIGVAPAVFSFLNFVNGR